MEIEKKIITQIPLEAAELTEEELANASPLELCLLGKFVKRPEEIPIVNIAQEESIVDPTHVQELADSMQGVSGQINRVIVGTQLEDGEVKYYIIDGFHRTEAKRMTSSTVEAEVLYGLSMEDIFNHRVLAVNSVRAVKFARLARWMQQSFNHSEWSKAGLSLSQAFGLTLQNSSGKRLGISPKEAIELKEWVREKASSWQGTIGTFYQIIRAVENSFPKIVEQVRTGGGGHGKGQGVLNPTRFMVMVEYLPNDFKQQCFMLRLIKEHDLKKKEVELVARAVATQPDPMALEMLSIDPLNVAEELLSELEEKPPGKEAQQTLKPGRMLTAEGVNAYDRRLTKEEMLCEISQLKQALENAQTALSAGGENKDLFWYQHSELSSREREAMKLLIENGLLPEEIASKLEITENQVFGLAISATTKACIRFRDQRFNRQIQKIQKRSRKKSSRQIN